MKPSTSGTSRRGCHRKEELAVRWRLVGSALCVLVLVGPALGQTQTHTRARTHTQPAAKGAIGGGGGGEQTTTSSGRSGGGKTNERLLAQPSTQTIQRLSKWPGGELATTGAATSNKGPHIQPAASIANAKVHNAAQDMQPLAGHHYGKSHGHHGKYYMYVEAPKKGSYKAGFKRGNHKHLIERKEWQHKSHAGGHMKWHSKKGKGSHKWEFKHYDKKAKGHHHHY